MHTDSRRVSPINGDLEGNSQVHDISLSQSANMFAYDGDYANSGGGGGGGGYEARAQYNYGWDF